VQQYFKKNSLTGDIVQFTDISPFVYVYDTADIYSYKTDGNDLKGKSFQQNGDATLNINYNISTAAAYQQYFFAIINTTYYMKNGIISKSPVY
jgi:hypothetical protein